MPLIPSPAVLRACDVLGALAKHPAERLSVSEVARAIDAPRATCDSILLALAERGLVHRSGDRRYSLGQACRILGQAAQAADAGLVVLEQVGQELAHATASSVVISSCDGTTTRVERMIDQAPGFAMRARVGESVPLAPPFGAVFVAWNDALAEDWLDRAGGGLTQAERDHAREALAATRRRGYAISTDIVRPELVSLLVDLAVETPDPAQLEIRDSLIRSLAPSRYLPIDIPDDHPQRVAQITAPVFDGTGTVAYSLMILGPAYDLQPAEIAALGRQLVDAASEASGKLRGIRF